VFDTRGHPRPGTPPEVPFRVIPEDEFTGSESARHDGHADLLRESIDGATSE
jgi:hypothetical protein